MLQNIRDNSQGWIAKTIIGIIVVLMAFTGIEAIFPGDDQQPGCGQGQR
ncbi:SurA N-terminal domain-containing protein [Pseudomonas lini]